RVVRLAAQPVPLVRDPVADERCGRCEGPLPGREAVSDDVQSSCGGLRLDWCAESLCEGCDLARVLRRGPWSATLEVIRRDDEVDSGHGSHLWANQATPLSR